MPKLNPIESVGHAEYISQFLLHEAFRYVHDAAAYAVADIIFGEKLESIEIADPSWVTPAVPEGLAEYLDKEKEITRDCLDPITAEHLADAWYSSLYDAPRSSKKIGKSTVLQSTTDMVGHIINLTVCLEATVNRHLFILKECKQLAPELYESIDRSELMPKLLFCFKEDILKGRLDIRSLKKLASMRNRAVHYRPDTSKDLEVPVKDLLEIWKQLSSIFSLTQGKPEESEIQELVDVFIEKWIS